MLCSGDNVTLQLRNPNLPIWGDWEGTLEIQVDPGITGINDWTEPFTGNVIYNYTLHNSDNEVRCGLLRARDTAFLNVKYIVYPISPDAYVRDPNAFKDLQGG